MSQLDSDIALGEKAAYALEYLQTKFDQLEHDLVEIWAEVNMHDQPTKDELLRSVKTLRKLRALIDADINNAALARQLIARSMKDRVRSVIGL